jgi:hypothetical protein
MRMTGFVVATWWQSWVAAKSGINYLPENSGIHSGPLSPIISFIAAHRRVTIQVLLLSADGSINA